MFVCISNKKWLINRKKSFLAGFLQEFCVCVDECGEKCPKSGVHFVTWHRPILEFYMLHCFVYSKEKQRYYSKVKMLIKAYTAFFVCRKSFSEIKNRKKNKSYM